jgi:glycosyltransferase involved in cell wall biosynthesis
MHILLIDDGIAFDGHAPDSRPLGGAEKAFARLAAALARRGHAVSAINRCAAQDTIEGVAWMPWETPRPSETEAVIAFRKARLLNEVADAPHRILWLWDSPASLADDAERMALAHHRPTLVFTGETHRKILKSELTSVVIVPGVGEAYRSVAANDSPPLVALTTTHPAHGLQRIVRLWRDRIHPARPAAELHIYSAVLRRALDGGSLPDTLESVMDDVRAGRDEGISVRAPLADPGMAEVYGRARVHLYPIIKREMYASTLAESQAAGLPAVVRATGGATAQILERVRNGGTGYFAPDDDAFVNLAQTMLEPEGAVYANVSRTAREEHAGRTWDAAAVEFEALFK